MQLIQSSKDSGNDEALLAEIEEHFRNIVESCSPVLEEDGGKTSPRFRNDDEDLLGDLGNCSTDEGKTAKAIPKPKKLKQRPTPHYLTATAASRAMQRPKSPFLKAGSGQQRLSKSNASASGGP